MQNKLTKIGNLRKGCFSMTGNEILVKINNNQVVTSSLQVAEVFEKQHKNVIQSIENLRAENSALGNFFFESTYKTNGNNKSYKMYYMNRDGFSLLVMGFTGKKALEWKLKYIEAFNTMEEKLKKDTPSLPDFGNPAEAARAWADQYEKRQLAEQQIKELAPKAEFHDAVVDSNGSISIGDFAKILRKNGIEIGRTRLFQWLREHKYLMSFGDWNSPTQRAVENGLFEVVEYPFELNSGRRVVTTTTRVTGKGQAYFMKLFAK